MEQIEAAAAASGAGGPYQTIKGPIMPHHYADNEEAKNLFNSLMSHNRHIQKEIATYRNQWKDSQRYKDTLRNTYRTNLGIESEK
mmetsp:Transcript_31765/g.48746  ORF Transcript_31765/g.48746 Transcript_31765/m.48746 type:complete len:85 (+) Transcript_31765:4607-4861(+)